MAATVVDDHLLLDGVEDVATLAPATFRVVRDFEIHLRDAGQFGVHLTFSSTSEGDLAGFPWWDHADADVRGMLDDDVPVGTVDKPFWDLEQGWRILIWERNEHVFIMQGSDEGSHCYHSWFLVPRETYFQAWRSAINRVRSGGGAFNSLDEALKQPDAVRALRLGNQGLTELPAEIGLLRNLEYLDLHLNKLSSLPADIGQLRRLRWLDLRFNRIEALPETFVMLESLESANLGDNRLRQIPSWIVQMPNLNVFFVPGNPVAPESMAWIREARPKLEVGYSDLEAHRQ